MSTEQGRIDQGNLISVSINIIVQWAFVKAGLISCLAEKVEALRMMFPNVAHAVLSTAFMEAKGDVNKAIDAVLAKGDEFFNLQVLRD